MNDQPETCLNPRCPHPVSMHSGRGCEAAIRSDNITYGRCSCREVGPRGGVSVRERAEHLITLADAAEKATNAAARALGPLTGQQRVELFTAIRLALNPKEADE